MPYLLIYYPPDSDTSPVVESLGKADVQFRLEPNFEELTPFAEACALQEASARVKEEIADFFAVEPVVSAEVATLPVSADFYEPQSNNIALFTYPQDGIKEEEDETQLAMGQMGNSGFNEIEAAVVKEEEKGKEFDAGQPTVSNEGAEEMDFVDKEQDDNDVQDEMPYLERWDAVHGEDLLYYPTASETEDHWEENCGEEDEDDGKMDQSVEAPKLEYLPGHPYNQGSIPVGEQSVNTAPEHTLDCPVAGCLQNFSSYKAMEAHMENHSRPLFCAICMGFWQSPSQLIEHYKNHSGRCASCGLFFTSARRMQRHKCISPHFCSECKIEFPSARELEAHVYQNHGRCRGTTACPRSYSNRKVIRIHRCRDFPPS